MYWKKALFEFTQNQLDYSIVLELSESSLLSYYRRKGESPDLIGTLANACKIACENVGFKGFQISLWDGTNWYQVQLRDNRNAGSDRFDAASNLCMQRTAAMERVNQLTKKEYWLLKAIANGKSIRSICQEGAIALNTFKVHRKSLFRKLGIKSSAQLREWVARYLVN